MSVCLLTFSFPGPGGPVTRGKRMCVFIHSPVAVSWKWIFKCLRREHTGGSISSYRDGEYLAVSYTSKRTETMNVGGLPGRELEDGEHPHL